MALLLGLGVFLVFDSCTSPPSKGSPTLDRVRSMLRRWLVVGGLGSVSPAQFAGACLGAGIAMAAIVIVLIGSTTVAVVGFCAGGYAPVGLLPVAPEEHPPGAPAVLA